MRRGFTQTHLTVGGRSSIDDRVTLPEFVTLKVNATGSPAIANPSSPPGTYDAPMSAIEIKHDMWVNVGHFTSSIFARRLGVVAGCGYSNEREERERGREADLAPGMGLVGERLADHESACAKASATGYDEKTMNDRG